MCSESCDTHAKPQCCIKRKLAQKKLQEEELKISEKSVASISEAVRKSHLSQKQRNEIRKILANQTEAKIRELSEPRMSKMENERPSRLSRRPSSANLDMRKSPDTSLSDAQLVRSQSQQTESIEALSKSQKSKISFPPESSMTLRSKKSSKIVDELLNEAEEIQASSHHSKTTSAGKSLSRKSSQTKIKNPESDFSDVENVLKYQSKASTVKSPKNNSRISGFRYSSAEKVLTSKGLQTDENQREDLETDISDVEKISTHQTMALSHKSPSRKSSRSKISQKSEAREDPETDISDVEKISTHQTMAPSHKSPSRKSSRSKISQKSEAESKASRKSRMLSQQRLEDEAEAQSNGSEEKDHHVCECQLKHPALFKKYDVKKIRKSET
jgi:hypothetical protein